MADIGAIDSIPLEVREEFIEGVYTGRYSPGQIPAEIYLRTSSILMDEVFKGFGRSWFDSRISVGDYDSLVSFHKNVFLFSGAKTTRQAMDLSRAILDADGNLVPFKQYAEKALQIDRAYNLNWLATERRTAFALAQSARQWKDIDEVKDVFTHLRYITKEDEHVRANHRPLNGIIRPVDDPFWDTHFPPVDWNCRCTWEQLMREEVPKRVGRVDKTIKEVPNPLFRINPGKVGEIFGSAHPYFKDVLKKYPYLNGMAPRPPVPRPAPPLPTPPKQTPPTPTPPKVKGPKPSPHLVDEIRRELGEEFEGFDMRAIQMASVKSAKAQRYQDLQIYWRTSKGSHYSPGRNKVFIEKYNGRGESSRWKGSKEYRSRVLYHELGHAIHYQLDEITAFSQADKPFLKFVDSYKDKINGGKKTAKALRQKFTKQINEIEREMAYNPRMTSSEFAEKLRFLAKTDDDLKPFEQIAEAIEKNEFSKSAVSEMTGAFADSVAALTKGRVGYGHSKSYWNYPRMSEMEIFAHSMENKFGGNPVFKALWPEFYEDTIAQMDRILKDLNIPT